MHVDYRHIQAFTWLAALHFAGITEGWLFTYCAECMQDLCELLAWNPSMLGTFILGATGMRRRTAITCIELSSLCTGVKMYMALYNTRLHLSMWVLVWQMQASGENKRISVVRAVKHTAASSKECTNLFYFFLEYCFVFVLDASLFQPCFIRQRIRVMLHPTWITMPSAFPSPCPFSCDCILRSCVIYFACLYSLRMLRWKENVHRYLTRVVVWSYAGGKSVEGTSMLYS